MRTELVSDALRMASRPRPGPAAYLPLRSGMPVHERGLRELAGYGIVLARGPKGECWDNAVAESFFATIKRELIDAALADPRGCTAPSSTTSRAGTTRPPAPTPRYLSPADYEDVHRNADRQAA